MTVYFIDPTAGSNGNGTEQSPYNSWSRVGLQSGNTYLQKSGTTYGDTIVLTASNVTISSYTPAGASTAAPTIGGVYFYGGSNDTLSNYTIRGNSLAGVVFSHGASSDSVGNSTISGNHLGVLFSNDAGGNNSVSSSNITGNNVFGVDIAQGSSGTVTNNNIDNNASHGIEIGGDNSNITYNYVYNNGTSVQGSSGIHTSGSPSVDGGNNNNISWNVITGTHDDGVGDGNGIEVDRFSHGNTVDGNITYLNDGAGIANYDAYNNTYIGNAAVMNQQGAYSNHGNHGEMYFSESSQNNGLDYGNVINMNLTDATVTGVDVTNILFDKVSADSQKLGELLSGGATGNLSTAQFSADAASFYNWWNTHSIPSNLQTTAHSALERVVSF